MLIEKGTNRVVLIGGGYVYKLPLSERGKLANDTEYRNYLENPDIVAKTEKYSWGLKQERLYNCRIFDWQATVEDVPDELKELFKRKLNNRFQVGQDLKGNWKFFDYEDIKFYS